MKIKDWNIEALTGYKPITTFYTDFSIAEPFGESAIKDTYERAFKIWKSDYKYLTELVMVLNWKCWEHEDDTFANCMPNCMRKQMRMHGIILKERSLNTFTIPQIKRAEKERNIS